MAQKVEKEKLLFFLIGIKSIGCFSFRFKNKEIQIVRILRILLQRVMKESLK